ncbi:replication protein RepA [Rickettsiella massiliensis]|uniref:replication protein RepA n=1 Tax=Rickettsiella massiliensis TaxID=676517 RepID=UPI00029B46CB|nr:replication protein RepA [Rickettsiella massiliensis]
MSLNQENLNKLITTALAIEAQEAQEAGAIGYMARALTQATMPHKRIESNEFSRENGAFSLVMLAPSKIGLPYGSIPRLLLAWISTEAVKTKQRELVLGRSLSNFMSQLDLAPTGGRWGSITRLKEQMERLFACSISCTYTNGNHWAIKNVSPVSDANLWWSPKNPSQTTIFESTLKLNEDFFNEIINFPVPIDLRALKLLKRSPLALDIYCWLTYRMSYLKRNSSIPWEVLQLQFGSNYAQTEHGKRDFKRAFLRELRKVTALYQDAKLEVNNGAIILKPGKPHISPAKIISQIE